MKIFRVLCINVIIYRYICCMNLFNPLNIIVMYGNYFKFEDFLVSETGLLNSVSSSAHLANIASLWDVLNYLRDKLGQPIVINSAFRTQQVNKAVGGAKRSLHMQGRAADIKTRPMYLGELWKLVEQYDAQYGLSEKILYPTFIHIAI